MRVQDFPGWHVLIGFVLTEVHTDSTIEKIRI